MTGDSDFYVGYEDRVPAGHRRLLWRVVPAAVLVVVATAVGVVLASQRDRAGWFEFGRPRVFEGRIVTSPLPALRVPFGDGRGASDYLLVAMGKHGADDIVAGLDGQWVRLQGTVISRAGETMLEVVPGSVVAMGASRPVGAVTGDHAESLGRLTLRGEVVDSKCFLGVMVPARRPVHRDCAVRCISGGIPAVLVAQGFDGEQRVFRLATADGRPLGRELLPLVAQPVEVAGEVIRTGDAWWLRTDVNAFRRLE